MSDAAAPATQPRPGGTAKGGNRACFKCGKTGHWSKDCTAPREEWIPQQPRAEAGVPQSPTDVGAAEGEDGAPAKPASVAKKKSNRKPKFTAVEHLLGPNGVSYVYNQIPEKFAAIAKGPGHEFGDFARLVGLYREWTRKMYPHATHEEVMKKVRTHSKTREVRATVREFKEKARLEAGGDPEDAPPPDFEAEDVFFPDEEDDDDDDDDVRAAAGKGAGAGDDDDEEEWNDAVHGGEGGGDDEDEELAILMEQERAFAEGSGSGSREELHATRAAEEARAAAFDEARRDGADDANANVDVNFDESSEDDDDFEIAAPRAGRAARAAPGERGKARKKVKERAGRKGGKKAEAAAAREAAEAAEEMLAPEPEAAPEPEGRKKLGGRRNRSKPADEDSDDSDGDAGDAAARRPRRKVATALDDSDDDDDDDGNTAAPLPTTMGGDAFDAEPLPADTRPSFLYDSDSDDVGGKKRKAEAEAEAE